MGKLHIPDRALASKFQSPGEHDRSVPHHTSLRSKSMSSRRGRQRQRARVMDRDSRRCGIHLGGCSKVIEPGDQYDLDHLIPQSFYMDSPDPNHRRKFESPWNLQPIHRSCHEAHRTGQLWGFPVFQCQCHSLHIKNRVLYLRYQDQLVVRLYEITPSVVTFNMGGKSVPVKMMSSVGSIGSKRHRPHRPRTHGKADRSRAHYVGHRFPALSDEEIEEFNSLEDERIFSGVMTESIEKFNSVLTEDGIISDSMAIDYVQT